MDSGRLYFNARNASNGQDKKTDRNDRPTNGRAVQPRHDRGQPTMGAATGTGPSTAMGAGLPARVAGLERDCLGNYFDLQIVDSLILLERQESNGKHK